MPQNQIFFVFRTQLFLFFDLEIVYLAYGIQMNEETI